jgi:hypothetical protein
VIAVGATAATAVGSVRWLHAAMIAMWLLKVLAAAAVADATCEYEQR